MNFKLFAASSLALLALSACKDKDEKEQETAQVTPQVSNYSSTENYLKLTPEFSDVEIFTLLSSEDQLDETPNFVYGSMADGAGLIRNSDNTYTLINNIEADYSVARIKLNKDLQPVSGEYILNAAATASTAQCSGSLISPEEHGFGPVYLSGGEWGGSSKGVFLSQVDKNANTASTGELLNSMGRWSTENAVAIGKDAYTDKTVVFIGDDEANNEIPSGQLGMYVGERGDLYNGKLYGLKVTDANVAFEMDMVEGQSYNCEFVELTEKGDVALLDAECKAKGVMGFSRLEDIDWRRGSAENNREVYFCVTGRKKDGLVDKGTIYGRVYKVELNDNDPTGAAKITCVLDGDKTNGKAKMFHSPDNITVTENYAYIQEDPNGYFDNADKMHTAQIYQYNLNNGTLKTVLSCDQKKAAEDGVGSEENAWEITGMIDVSEQTGLSNAFMVITQNHGWNNDAFTDYSANPSPSSNEGSQLYLIKGLER